MKNYIIDMSNIERNFSIGFPLKQVGYLYSLVKKETSFSDKLEFCLRCSSEEEYAVDIINGREYRTAFPHIIIKRPGVTHNCAINKPRNAIYFQYNIDINSIMENANLISAPFIWEFTITPEISLEFQKIKTMLESSHKRYVADHLDLAALNIIELLIEQKNNHIDKYDKQEDNIRKIASYFTLNFKEDIDLDKLIAKNGLSKRSFFRYWKKYYDKSPAEYIKELKINYACSMLRETDTPIWQITQELNYKNIYYLCKIFKQKFGISPQQYRNRTYIDLTYAINRRNQS